MGKKTVTGRPFHYIRLALDHPLRDHRISDFLPKRQVTKVSELLTVTTQNRKLP